MAKVYLKNISRGARGVRNDAHELTMIEPGQTAEVDISSAELEDALATGSFEKGKKGEAAVEGAAAESQALGEPGPGDPPVPDEPAVNEVPATPTRRTRG